MPETTTTATATTTSAAPLSALVRAFRAGRVDRRTFLTRATALGMSPALALMVLHQPAIAQTPVASPAAGTPQPGATPEVVLDPGVRAGQQRGEGGELRILQWQAPTTLSSHAATGKKDKMAAALVSEPLMSYAPDGSLIPRLVTEVPTVANGSLSSDLTQVTYTLRPGITWSDGEPLTAEDIAFTWRWLVDPANPTAAVQQYAMIDRIEVLDELTARLTYGEPQPGWYIPFTGTNWGVVYPRHILEGGGQAANDAFSLKPIGTGPFVVESFTPGDQAIYAANPHYREPGKPFFSRVILKGGGDAPSAARAVVQTGEYAFAPALQLEPEILAQLNDSGSRGEIVVRPGSSLERLLFNFCDPHTEVDGERAKLGTPHPFFTDHRVRQAFSLAIDKATLVERLYLPGETAASDFLVGVPEFASTANHWRYDPDAANRLLDEAGWSRGEDGFRAKDGVKLAVTYAAAVNSVRQKTQQVIKANWEAVGIRTELMEVDPGIFFDGSPGNDQGMTHFYTDVQMWADGPDTPYPLSFFYPWYAGPDNANVAQKANNWTGVNQMRYVNPAFDALYDEASTQTDPTRLVDLFVGMNDLAVQDVAGVPLVQRSSAVYAIAHELTGDAVQPSAFEMPYWNIANWTRTES
ncbi:MAG TPA: peptide ABC transporter substrate-binding protein [Thermomicrobiales bacterium]|nr:peptide ABC transporter substrate-binding protein [Thermomicrobiales bacterium]